MTAFEEIVRQHQGMVYSIAYHYLRDRSAAEELAQDVFLQLYRHLEKMESPRHMLFWLRRVAAHRSIDYQRRHLFRKTVPLEDAENVSAPAGRGDPMLARMLFRLVAGLPAKTRMILTLRFQEDLQPLEIAEVLDIPVNTVKSRLSRSLAFLQEKLSHREKVAL